MASTSSPADDVSECIHFVESATNNYQAGEDQVVELRVNGRTFSVSKSRLTQRSPIFSEMFKLGAMPAGNMTGIGRSNGSIVSKVEYTDGTEKVIVDLHNDPEEFRHFLWYLHADPLSAHKLTQARPTAQKCDILLGIASVAHMYEALDVAEWAMGLALQMFMVEHKDRLFSLDSELALRLLCIAGRFQEAENAKFLKDARDIVCDALNPCCPSLLSDDPIAALLLLKDTYVLGHAYFYVLLKGKDYWLSDPRLTASDRQRLVCGGFCLSRRPSLTQSYADVGKGISSSYSRPLPTPPTMSNVWNGPGPADGLAYGAYPVPQLVPAAPIWKPSVHRDIEDKRNELWAMFDNEPWRLTD